uniref:Uncharacterized protein n=1 Tax=Lactuca sativa TaxID=4236 RepID=A0A9R1WR95_LACSA|nr:hypothetical protein LSAT_V11C100033580 [Lactuca sativa]
MGSSSKDQLPPYPNAARISDSQCYSQYTASLKCNHTLSMRRYFFISVWKNLALIKANVKNILMSTRNARRKRERLDWSAIEVDHFSHEASLMTPNISSF